MDAATRTDLGAPLEPLATPDPPADETPADEVDPEATVTLPSRPLAGTARPQAPPRAPAYGSYGGGDDLGTQRIARSRSAAPRRTRRSSRPARSAHSRRPRRWTSGTSAPAGDRRKRGVAALLVVVGARRGRAGRRVPAGPQLAREQRRRGRRRHPERERARSARRRSPTGFTPYQGSGFTVGIPNGWPPKVQRDGVVDAREPGTRPGSSGSSRSTAPPRR